MQSHKKLAPRLLGILVLGAALTAVAADSTQLLSSTEEPQEVSLQAQVGPDGSVNGTIRNQTDGTVRDVQVLIRHDWLWADEFNPGPDSPARFETLTISEEIPAGGTHTFTYRPEPPLPARDDGRFVTHAELGAYEVVTGG